MIICYLTTPKSKMTNILQLCISVLHTKIQGYYFSSFGFPSILLAAVTLLLFLLLTCFISNQQQQGWWLAPNHFPWVLLLLPLAPPPLPPAPRRCHYIQNEHTAILPFFCPTKEIAPLTNYSFKIQATASLRKYSKSRAQLHRAGSLLLGAAGQKGWP